MVALTRAQYTLLKAEVEKVARASLRSSEYMPDLVRYWHRNFSKEEALLRLDTIVGLVIRSVWWRCARIETSGGLLHCRAVAMRLIKEKNGRPTTSEEKWATKNVICLVTRAESIIRRIWRAEQRIGPLDPDLQRPMTVYQAREPQPTY